MDVRYSARDLLGVPSLLSLVRVPLAVSFPFVVSRPWLAALVIGLAAASDVADGWWARHYHRLTPTGAILDGLTDKIFVVTVVISLFVSGKLSPLEIALLGARDIGELFIGVAIAVRKDARALHEEQRANALGKATTTLQIGAVLMALFHAPGLLPVAAVTGAVGLAAAVSYARSAL